MTCHPSLIIRKAIHYQIPHGPNSLFLKFVVGVNCTRAPFLMPAGRCGAPCGFSRIIFNEWCCSHGSDSAVPHVAVEKGSDTVSLLIVPRMNGGTFGINDFVALGVRKALVSLSSGIFLPIITDYIFVALLRAMKPPRLRRVLQAQSAVRQSARLAKRDDNWPICMKNPIFFILVDGVQQTLLI